MLKKIILSIFISLMAFNACEIKFDNGSATITGDGSNAVTAFYFSKDDNLQFGLEKDVVGRFNGRQIFLTLPFGVVPSTLVPTINISEGICSMQSGKEYDFSKEIQPVEFSVSRDDGSIELYVVYVEEVSKTAKQITSFRFKEIDAEIKIIGNNIDALVSGGTNLLLTPIIEHEGDTISPGSGEIIDFSDSYNEPVEYTVTAYDGSTTKYYVTVSDRTASSKEITSFTIVGIPEAQVTISGLEIEVGVPEGSEFMLTPIIEITGESIDPASGTAQVFSDDVLYTVFAEDGSSQTYTVKVKEIPSSNKEITGFEFRVEDNPSLCNSTSECNDVKANIAGVNISAKVPYGTNIKSLIPRMEYPDSQGAQIMPASGIAQNFENSHENPFLYTVIAADESFVEYLVTVEIDEESKPSSEKEITSLSLEIDGKTYNAEITPNNSFITVYVPASADLTNLTANIDYTEGAIMVPAADEVVDFSKARIFTITAADDSVKYYSVVAKKIAIKTFAFEKSKNRNEGLDRDYFAVVNEDAIELTVPYDEKIDNLKPTIEFYGDSVNPNVDSAWDFTSPVTYKINSENNTVVAGDDFYRDYEVIVYREQVITYFAFNKDENEGTNLQTDVIGYIGPEMNDSGSIIINLRVPYDTIIENLVPEIHFSGKAIDPLSGVAQDFSNPVEYNLLAGRSRTILTKSYSVVVTKELNYAKEIESFSFTEDLNPEIPKIYKKKIIKAAVIGREITVTLPYGSDVTILRPEIAISESATVSPESGEMVDFSNPVIYTVTAEDGSQREYRVSVKVALNDAKDIEMLAFYAKINSFAGLNTDVVLEKEKISKMGNEIIVPVPISYKTGPIELVPYIEHEGVSISPEFEKMDFSNGVNYTVTAQNGSTKEYLIRVVSDTCEINSFVLSGDENNWCEDAVGKFDNHFIQVKVPVASNLFSLKETIEHNGKEISLIRGPKVNGYVSDLTYRVTAESGKHKDYWVKVMRRTVIARSTSEKEGYLQSVSTPWIAMNRCGTSAITLWNENDDGINNIYAKRYSKVGYPNTNVGKWEQTLSIENEGSSFPMDPQAVVDFSGNSVALWAHHDGSKFSIRSNVYETNWNDTSFLIENEAGTASNPHMAMDSFGNAIAVWMQVDSSTYSIMSNRYVNGSGWDDAEYIEFENSGPAFYPQIAMDSFGNAIAVWVQRDGQGYRIKSNRYDINTGWADTVQTIGMEMNEMQYPKIAMGKSKNAIVAWKDDGALLVSKYNGVEWSSAEYVPGIAEGKWINFQISMDYFDNAILVGDIFTSSEYAIVATRFNGVEWSNAEKINNENVTNARSPQIAMAPSGYAIVVWKAQDLEHKYRIGVRKFYDSIRGWGSVEYIESQHQIYGEVASTPNIAMDSSGDAMVVWKQRRVDTEMYSILVGHYTSR